MHGGDWPGGCWLFSTWLCMCQGNGLGFVKCRYVRDRDAGAGFGLVKCPLEREEASVRLTRMWLGAY